jgi:alpha-mannosidase
VTPAAAGIVVGGVELRFLDEPDVGDLYNFCWADHAQRPAPPREVTIDGDAWRVVWEGLSIEGRALRVGDQPFLILDGTIRNTRPDHRLRLHVDLPEPATCAWAGAPLEVVERPLVGEGSEVEAPSATWPARHVVLAGGAAVFCEGVFEYEVVEGRQLAITLLRCVGTISRDRLATRPWAAGPPTPTPAAQMRGETRFRLGVWIGADRPPLLDVTERYVDAVASMDP